MLMVNFRDAIVAEELKHIMYALQDSTTADNNARCNAVIQRYKKMREIQNLMTKRPGDRVVLCRPHPVMHHHRFLKEADIHIVCNEKRGCAGKT